MVTGAGPESNYERNSVESKPMPKKGLAMAVPFVTVPVCLEILSQSAAGCRARGYLTIGFSPQDCGIFIGWATGNHAGQRSYGKCRLGVLRKCSFPERT